MLFTLLLQLIICILIMSIPHQIRYVAMLSQLRSIVCLKTYVFKTCVCVCREGNYSSTSLVGCVNYGFFETNIPQGNPDSTVTLIYFHHHSRKNQTPRHMPPKNSKCQLVKKILALTTFSVSLSTGCFFLLHWYPP